MAASSRWKAIELDICRRLRLARNPGSGSNGGMGSCGDCAAGRIGLDPRAWIYAEIKHYARSAVFTLWKDTQAKAKAENRRPFVIMHEKNTRIDDSLVIMRLEFAQQLLDIADANGTRLDIGAQLDI